MVVLIIGFLVFVFMICFVMLFGFVLRGIFIFVKNCSGLMVIFWLFVLNLGVDVIRIYVLGVILLIV